MTPRDDLSGHWSGYYTQHDHRRTISADLAQAGERLTGTMNDDCTLIERPVSELVLEEGLPPGADEQIVKQLRDLVPQAPAGPVLAEVELPPLSLLDGEVVGRTIRFQKIYQGPTFAGYRIGHLRVGQMGEGQRVLYRGRLNDDGTEIEGRWQIEPRLGHSRRIEGDFWLRRQALGEVG